MKVGLVVMDEDPADALRIVRAADRAGVHSLWTIDYYNRSSLTRAAAFAAVSGQFTAERVAAREALARGDVPGVIAAGEAMVEERAVFGTPDDVAGQLRRYAGAVDWALLYPPHFGVDAEHVHANELSLIEIASGWTP